DSSGVMQTGVIKIAGKVYYFNNSGVMQTGTVKIGNTVYTFASNGQAIGNKIPKPEKEFDSNNNLINQNNGSNIGSNNSSNNNNSGSGNSNVNQNINKPNNNIQGSGNETSKPDNSGANQGSTGGNSSLGSSSGINVEGLPVIQEKYPVIVQSSAENKILELMNQKRTEAGLKPLTMDNTLLSVARYKSDHMIQNNYFSHTNPDGTNWTNWLKAIGYKYTATAENIAYTTHDPVDLFNQWWNSTGHRENMMNPSYTKVGIGVVYGNGKYMGTQTFSN
ncbi:MAG: CAP domain-containing protein, partial [Clostridium sp.]